jgi:methylmalonyl-CoA mutase N-terminal domain/subunit
VEESAWSYDQRYENGQDVVVGVNKYVTETQDDVDILRVDPKSEDEQVERLKKFKENRDHDELDKKLEELRETARSGSEATGARGAQHRGGNLLVPIRAALKANATIGEVCGVMRDEFGEYQEA